MRFALFLLFVLMLVACDKFNTTIPSVPLVQKVECWFDPIEDISAASCYEVYVYENHADTTSSIISFPLVKLKAKLDKNKSNKTPLIDFGGGGPGGESGIGEDDIAWLIDIYRPFSLDEGRDLYLFEVRGTGLATPKLMCDSQLSTAQKLWTSNLSNEERDQYDFETFMNCIEELRSNNIEPLNYNSLNVAKDVEFIRQSLAIDKFNVMGVSYASRYAQTYVREYPEQVEKIILDSPVFPHIITTEDFSNSFDAFVSVFEKLGARGFDAEALEQQFFTLFDKFNQQNLAVQVDWPVSHKAKTVYMSGDDFQQVLFNYLYVEDNYLQLPKIFNRLQTGDASELLEALEFSIEDSLDTSFSSIINVTTYCYEEYPFLNKQRAKGSVKDIPQQLVKSTLEEFDYISKTCEAVTQSNVAPDIEGKPIVSDKPVLLLSGELDPIIPFEDTFEALENFANGSIFIVKNASHFTIDDACIQQSISLFLDAGSVHPDAIPCLAEKVYKDRNDMIKK